MDVFTTCSVPSANGNWVEFVDHEAAIAAKDAEIERLSALLSDTQGELRQERGLKALLANGMPPTGNPDFDTILATHPIAAMIQRGWLPGVTGFEDLTALESAICHFWGVKTIAEAVNPTFIIASRAAKEAPCKS